MTNPKTAHMGDSNDMFLFSLTKDIDVTEILFYTQTVLLYHFFNFVTKNIVLTGLL